ncbi:MAG: alpha/beta hydrolase [Xanthomonadales bacterium]|nr:alpha/beta hydrolase [Xanthomonadales bacterium]
MKNSELPTSILAWRDAGEFLSVSGLQVFFRRLNEQRTDLPWLVCFHGFPTSSWDWHLLLPGLQQHWRVLVFDFPGYGLSDKPARHDYSLLCQLDVAEGLLRYCGITRFDLLAHDMGNSVACELLFRREQGNYPFALNSLVMLNGGVYMDLHQPLLTQRLLRTPILGPITARLSSWRLFRLQYPRVYANPAQFNQQHYQEQWALIIYKQGRKALSGVASYMKERVRRGERWTGPLHRLELPFSLIWGQQDPVAVPAIAERIAVNNPHAVLHQLGGVGHYPQLEAPHAVTEALIAHAQHSQEHGDC